MTLKEMKDFAEQQIAYYTKDIETQSRWIANATKEIADSRKEDRELQATILADDSKPEIVKKLFTGKYESGETKKLLNERRRYCRNRQYAKARVEYYTKEVAKYERMIEQYGNV